MPQYFIASAYLLDRQSHEPLCREYTTQAYTKKMQDFMEMTTEDFQEEKVLNLDEDTSKNFAVFNENTVQISSRGGAGQMTDNGGGQYTFTDPGEDVAALKRGDIFSYTSPDGEVSIVKVGTIQNNGGMVTITEDEDVKLEEVFDVVKLEGGYQADGGEPRASAIELDGDYSVKEGFDWTKKFGSGSLTATLKASGALSAAAYAKVYLAWSYQCVELSLTMKANFDCSASGKLARQSVDLLPDELAIVPVVGITVTFMPRLQFEASGNVSFSAEMVTVAGFSCDGNGLVDKSSGPKLTKCDFHVEASVYLGLSLRPAVHVGIRVGKKNLDVGSLTLDLQAGTQITGKMDVALGTEERPHLCKQCISGDITGKSKLDVILDMVFIGEKKASFPGPSRKLTDFYYSFDYDEFGWTTCPHFGSKPTEKPGGQEPGDQEPGNQEPGDQELVDQGSCGENLKWQLGGDGKLTISGTGDMTDWSDGANSVPWHDKRDKIQSVVLESGVTSIGSYSFYECTNLQHIDIPDQVTSIEPGVFIRCANLHHVDIPDQVTSIGSCAFLGCTSLQRINIPDQVHTIGVSAFQECTSLQHIDIPDRVYAIDPFAFRYCTSLTKVKLGSGVDSIASWAFDGCTRLSSITFPSGLTAMFDHAFLDCASLTKIQFTGNAPSMSDTCFEGVTATAYYPAGNDTWNNKPDTGGTITWVAYDPASAQSAMPQADKFSVQASSPEDPNGAFIAAEPPTAQASSRAQDGSGQTAAFTGLTPGGDYVLLVSKDLQGAGILSPANLLYIAQGRADGQGSLSFAYIPRTGETTQAKIFGPAYDPGLVDQRKDIAACTASLLLDTFVYDGQAQEPIVTVKDGAATLKKGTDYTLAYERNINAGVGRVRVTGIGDYTGEKILGFTIQKASSIIIARSISRKSSKKAQSFNIMASVNSVTRLSYRSSNPKVTVDSQGEVKVPADFTGKAVITIIAGTTENYRAALKKITVTVKATVVKPAKTTLTKAAAVSKGKKCKMTLRWKKAAKAAGYQIQYATDRKFTQNAKKLNISGGGKTAKSFGSRRLARAKKCYVRIRSYRKNGGKTVYSRWSGTRQVKMKKK